MELNSVRIRAAEETHRRALLLLLRQDRREHAEEICDLLKQSMHYAESIADDIDRDKSLEGVFSSCLLALEYGVGIDVCSRMLEHIGRRFSEGSARMRLHS